MNPRVMVYHADMVMWRLFDKEYGLKCVQTEAGYDLQINGVEVGSYGKEGARRPPLGVWHRARTSESDFAVGKR